VYAVRLGSPAFVLRRVAARPWRPVVPL